MTEIKLYLDFHNSKERLFAQFEYDSAINKIIKKVKGAAWSQSKKQWHFDLNKETVEIIRHKTEKFAVLDISFLKQQLTKRKQILSVKANSSAGSKPQLAISKKTITAYSITDQNILQLDLTIKTLQLKAHSQNTISLYRSELLCLMRLLKNRSITSLTQNQLKSYLLWLLQVKKYSEAKVHTTINALKFYFELVLHKPKMFFEIPRPKKSFKLPTVHSQNEVKKIITATENTKHRTMLMAGYAGGLRISEIINLKIKDIDSERMVINIRNAKGKKDRQVSLSPLLLKQLRMYYKEYHPKKFLFEGMDGGNYSARSLQQVFKAAKINSVNIKQGGIHSLRHNYATHLLEQGTDIKIIQELLGHNSLRTTEIYTHVSKKLISKIESPLDRLDW